MGSELELISDGDGLAMIGSPGDVELFMQSNGLAVAGQEPIGLADAAHGGAVLAQLGVALAEKSGRWVRLTKESAEAVRKFGLTPTKTRGVSHAMIGRPGRIKQWIQIDRSPSAILTNPATLSGAAGLMAQLAMKQQMAEITDYLATIDEKLDEVLRMQKNQMLARLDGVALAVREASLVGEAVGRISDITWSKVQNSSIAILETQSLALRQLADLADKLEQQRKVDTLVEVAETAVGEAKKLLMVLARCFQLHDAIAVIELDRVLDADPEDLDRHRLGLHAARADRIELITQHTARLLGRLADAASLANSKVLLHPVAARAIVSSNNLVAIDVHEFDAVIGVDAEHEAFEARRWASAAVDARDKAKQVGADGVVAAKQASVQVVDQAKTMKGKVADKLAAKRLRQGSEGDED